MACSTRDKVILVNVLGLDALLAVALRFGPSLATRIMATPDFG